MRRRVVWLTMLVAGLPAVLPAQEDTVPERPFIRGGVYDKPYLAQLRGRAAIGGYAEFHGRYERTEGISESSFVPMRFNLFTAARVSDLIRFGAELEFEEGTEEIKLEFAAIDFTIHRGFAFRAGMLLSPLGRFNLSHDSPLNDFTDRPVISTEMFGVALSEPGLGALGTFLLGGTGRVTYEAYLVNGFHDGLISASAEGTRIPAGAENFEDNNSSPAFVGRVAWSPSLDLEVGLSSHRGAYNVFEADGAAVDDRRNLTMVAVDVDAAVGRFRISGELGSARIDIPPALEGLNASRQAGVYVDVLYDFGRGLVATLPNSFFSVGLRLDAVDFDRDIPGDDTRQVTVGLNFRPTAETAFKLNYVRGRERDRFNNAEQFGRLLFSVATYF